jgi:PDZ domain-containing protein
VRRRGATLLVGTVLLIVLVVLAWWVPVPYVEEGPGPTWDTLGKDGGKEIITVQGAPASNSAGQLRMVTVGVLDDISLWQALRGWLSGDDSVVPREVVYPPDKTTDQVNQQNAEDFQQSQNSATTAALRELGYPVMVTVGEVTAGAPADGRLQVGDVVTAVDGTKVTSGSKLTQLIKAKPAGTPLAVNYTRNGVAASTTITAKDDNGTPRVGISIKESQPSPITVSFSLANVGGPSAGLMFALGIVDKVDPADLTGGKKIAGTGEIDEDGNVGIIGGIPHKMVAAKRDGATVFLVPAGNCAEALDHPVKGLRLVKVNTLDDALSALSTLRAGGNPTPCTR